MGKRTFKQSSSKDEYNREASNMMFFFKGELSSAVFAEIIDLLEENLKKSEIERLIEKKIFYIVQEALQNTQNYVEQEPLLDVVHRMAELKVERKKKKYSIKISNYMIGSQVQKLSEHIDKVNKMSQKELRDFYLEILSNQEFSAKGGAGLGVIEIARRSGQKLKYSLKKVTENYCLFNLEISIPFN
jgi:predicted DNA-binding protein (UPF0278 family)